MKKIYLNKKSIFIISGTLIVVAAGLLIYTLAPRISQKEEKDSSAESRESQKTVEKGLPEIKPPVIENPNKTEPTPKITTNLPILEGVSLTVYLSTEATFSQDGKTIIPAGSLQPYLFPQGSGVFSLQKKVGDNWIDVASNVSYAGHGGIAGAYAGPSENQINYRAIKLERGNPILVSKTYTINRAEIADGVKTYN